MANDDRIEIVWDGLEEMLGLLDGFEDEFFRHLKNELTQYGLLVEEGARALAPRDTGDLEQSIHFDAAKRVGDRVIVEGGTNMEYALKRHEAPYSSGTHDKHDNGALFPNYYVNGRGKRTRSKSTWRGFQAGRKYLSNAVTATEEEFEQAIARALEKTLGGV
ncbi:HK97 gp10 family phage protein [Paenibacillus sp.]